jgi:Peptidase family M28
VRLSKHHLGLLLLAAAMALTVWRFRAPAALGSDAPTNQFSAGRALAELDRVLDGRPHPVGSPANTATRARLVDRLRATGLAVRTRRHVGCSPRGMCSELVNVIAMRQAGPDVLLLAGHYDSVGAGMGAADDGAAVGTLLEVARLLAARPAGDNSVAILLTDGEEAGLLGARAFVEEDPLWPRVRAVVNLEARGTTGPSMMFEAAGSGREIVSGAQQLARPITSSLFAAVYERLSNDTDFSVFREHGVRGFNFAFIDAVPRYHTSLDDRAHLDPRSVQHHGDNLWALAQHLEASELSERTDRGEPAVWFDVLGLGVVHWPLGWSAPLAWLALALLALGGMGAARRGGSWWRGIAKGAAAALAAALVSVALGFALAALIGLNSESALPRVTRTLFPFLALVTAPVAVVAGAARWLKNVSPWARFVGVWLLWSALGIAIAHAFAPACHLFVAPALVAGALSLGAWSRDTRALTAATAVGIVVATALWFRVALGLVAAMGVIGHPVVTLAVALCAGLALPLLAETPRRNRTASNLVAFAVAMTLVAALRSPFDEGHPQRMSIVHAQRDGTARWWVDASWGVLPDDLVAQLEGATLGPPLLPIFALRRAMSAAAPRVDDAAVDASWTVAGRGRYRLHLTSRRGAPVTGVILPPTMRPLVRVAGKMATPFALAEGPLAQHRVVACLSSQPAGCELELWGIRPGDRLEVFDLRRALPSSAEPLVAARDAGHGVPSQDGDLSLLSHTIDVPAGG